VGIDVAGNGLKVSEGVRLDDAGNERGRTEAGWDRSGLLAEFDSAEAGDEEFRSLDVEFAHADECGWRRFGHA
jgi:hypothetical protein